VKIILINIPADTQPKQIMDFIEPAIRGSLLKKGGRIENISILVQRGNHKYDYKYYGLVTIMPDAIAEQATKKLNRKRINGKNINVLEYKVRRSFNDRRFNRDHDGVGNRRLGSRRWQILEDIKEAEIDLM
jgi:hypothetical protein